RHESGGRSIFRSAYDEIKIPVAVPEPSIQYQPSMRLEPASRDRLAAESELLALSEHGNSVYEAVGVR
ncbi:MAG: hypothetical protein ABI026_11050, partial [Gemmatimonadaceae bacterium]